jgi:hypothetical protein
MRAIGLAIACKAAMIEREVGGRRSAVGGRRSAVGGRRSAVGGRRRDAAVYQPVNGLIQERLIDGFPACHAFMPRFVPI